MLAFRLERASPSLFFLGQRSFNEGRAVAGDRSEDHYSDVGQEARRMDHIGGA